MTPINNHVTFTIDDKLFFLFYRPSERFYNVVVVFGELFFLGKFVCCSTSTNVDHCRRQLFPPILEEEEEGKIQ
jgi:hypothetical protein